MDSKMSLKDRFRRTRSSIFSFSSQKQTTTAATATTSPSKVYNLRDPNNHRPSSATIDRQFIAPYLEKEIRYACYRLQCNIERGIPSRDLSSTYTQAEEREKHQGQENNEKNRVQDAPRMRPPSSSSPAALQMRAERHDSGVDMLPQYGTITGTVDHHHNNPHIPHFAASTSAPRSATGGSSRIPSSSKDMTSSSGETLVSPTQQGVRTRAEQSNIENDALYELVLEHRVMMDLMPPLAPSFSRPHLPPPAPESLSAVPDTVPSPSSRLVRKRPFENLQHFAIKESRQSSSASSPDSHSAESGRRQQQQQPPPPRYSYSWLPRVARSGGAGSTSSRPVSAVESGAGVTGYRRANSSATATTAATTSATAAEAVIVDSSGLRRTITGNEERHRQRDLQQAIREKMFTGRIWPRPPSASVHLGTNNDNSGKRESSASRFGGLHGYEHIEHITPVPTDANANANANEKKSSKRKSILNRLSFFGFLGSSNSSKDRNGSLRSKDTVGFSRIVEAV